MKVKGQVELTLKDEQGNIVHHEKKHNLVTNFFTEYFRPLGTTRGYPQDYTIENMVGGILLMENPIVENVNTVLMPAGNKMTGNACVGKVNGPGTAISEMGSYNNAETGWQDNGDYKMKFEWVASQANGQISAICLTSKNCGYAGEGNGESHNFLPDTSFDMTSLPMGTEYSRSIPSGHSFFGAGDPSENEHFWVKSDQFQNTTNSVARTGKLTVSKYYFPKTSIDFYKGVSTRITPISEVQYNVPNDILNEFIVPSNYYRYAQPNYFTFEGNNTHFVFGSAVGNSNEYTYLSASDKNLYCFHFDRENGVLTVDKVVIADEIVSELVGSSYGAVAVFCNADTLILMRLTCTQNANNPVFFINIATGTYVRKEIFIPRNPYYSSGAVEIHSNFLYYTNVWYLALRCYGYSDSRYCLIKVDNVRQVAELTNGIVNTGCIRGNTSEYSLAYFTGSNYKRNPKYIATIYNLDTTVTKTANLSMEITYTLSFAEEE